MPRQSPNYYQALHEANIEPDWVCGVSIGAINSAIIAGNRPDRRMEKLQQFWDRITSRKIWHYTPDGDVYRQARNFVSSFMTSALGQPGFFEPHPTNPWLSPAGARTATSYYDTEPLRRTLLELVDFDLINEKKIRFAVGAVNVLSGNFIYFDNAHDEIIPEHVMASGALPPALPMVRDRNRPFLGWRHRLQHAAAASARPGRQPELAGVPGRSVQCPRHAAARHPGRDGPPQGHHVFLPHAP